MAKKLPLQELIWPDGSDIQYSQNITTVQFGDGYSQTAPIGINITNKTWAIYYKSLEEADMKKVRDFLLNLKGELVTATPVGEKAQTWRFDPTSLKVQIQYSGPVGNIYHVNFTLKSAVA